MRGMNRSPRPAVPLAAVAVGLGLALAACGSGGHSPAGRPASAASTAPTVATTPGSAAAPSGSSETTVGGSVDSTVPSTTVSTPAPSGPAPCATASLSGSLTGANGAAGSTYYQLVLTNTGTATCVVEGYPGVSFVYGTQGMQVGAPAARTPGTVTPVTLAPGASAHATLQITEAANYSHCGMTATDGLRVYPPNQQTALLIDHNDEACADTNDVTLHVGPFE